MPSVITPNSEGMPQPDNAGAAGAAARAQGGVPPGKLGGEIMISRSEAAALTALETDDPKMAFKRAKEESGLDDNQLRKLQARARRARSAGFTLKGGNLVLKPTNHPEEAPEEEGLARKPLSQLNKELGGKSKSTSTAMREPDEEPAAVKKAKTKIAKEMAADAMVESAYFYLVNEADRSVEDELREMWSDAARAAAIANRRARAGGKKTARGEGRKAYLAAGGKASNPGVAFSRGSKKASGAFKKADAADAKLQRTADQRGHGNSKVAARQADSAAAKAWNTQAKASNQTVSRQRSRFEGISDRASKVPKSERIKTQKLKKTAVVDGKTVRIRKSSSRAVSRAASGAKFGGASKFNSGEKFQLGKSSSTSPGPKKFKKSTKTIRYSRH